MTILTGFWSNDSYITWILGNMHVLHGLNSIDGSTPVHSQIWEDWWIDRCSETQIVIYEVVKSDIRFEQKFEREKVVLF